MAQLGRAGRLGRSGCTFKSCHPDMAKIKKGSKVELVKKFTVGYITIPEGSEGIVKDTLREGFTKKCKVRFEAADVILPESYLEKA